MVTFIKSDLEFILQQIEIAEAHAAGADLATLVAHFSLPFGLRTVDGTFNNLLPGNEHFGAADTLFPRLVDSNPLNDADGDTIDLNGPAPGGEVTNNDYGQPGNVADADPRIISNLIADMTSNNPAAVQAFVDRGMGTIRESDGALLDLDGNVIPAGTLLEIPNQATDEGLSAPFNSWFTLFGQFFDHGLDLVTKGGNGAVFVPLQPDDPLITVGPDGVAGTGDEVTNPAQQFMVLTRATPTNGEHTNTTTSWVDQNQTYTSHASHQAFLREYVTDGTGRTVATGHLLEGNDGGLANWAEVKASALQFLGIALTDADVVNVPLLRTDAYGKFIPDPTTGFAQVIIGAGTDGVLNTADDLVVSGTPSNPVNLFDVLGDGSNVQAQRTGHAFLDDIAHAAGPFDSQTGLLKSADTDSDVGLSNGEGNPTAGSYDDELLDLHKITGDGRGNENIGLTSVHHVFHSEHNRLVELIKDTVLATGDAAFIAEWQLPDGSWNGERLFQAAKFGTEMQYQHLVFEEFARKVQPLVNVFGPYQAEIDPSIVAEFAHVVYRFGHSMLNEDVAIMNPDGTTSDVGLIEAFLNPVMFDAGGLDDVSAGAVIRGMTRQTGNEIDEFVTGALRNNLLGLPLDLAVLNLARARETGSPTLNDARAQFFAGTGDTQLKPYESWVEFAQNAKHELSVINFIAAYGLHEAVTSAITLEDKRKAAVALVLGDNDGTPDTVLINGVEVDISDRLDFLNSTNGWTAELSGLNDIDFWIGGLAEAQQPFGGLLGSTFNFVFETQLENLQDSDRFYYLARLAGTNFLTELEGNSFAQMVINNTNLGEDGMHLPGDIFSVPNWILEVDQTKQVTGLFRPDQLDIDGNPMPGEVGREDPTGASIFTPLVVRNNPATVGPDTNYLAYTGGDHVVLGGTDNADILIAGQGDDTVWGDGGNDRIEGGDGVDQLLGGDGDDIITDSNGDDNIKAGNGNDVVNSGDGFDLILLQGGNDFSVGGEDLNETFGGEGNDYIIAGDDADTVFGDGGDDWIEGGTGNDLLQGDFGAPFQDSAHVGNDIIIGGAGNDDYDSESGDDIMLADDGIERNEGMLGFDWVTYKNDTQAADADMFFTGLLPPDLDAIRDRFDLVEGLSGWDFDDKLRGDDADAAFLSSVDAASGQNNALNTAAQIALIDGLSNVLAGATSFDGGNIILGGAGHDIIEGRGGDDILDGDAKLNVRLAIYENLDGTGAEIGFADGMDRPVVSSDLALSGKTLVELMFAGTLNPGQLGIVREVLNSDGTRVSVTGGSTNMAGDVDSAVFRDVSANYTIETNLAGDIADGDGDGYITVQHNGGGIDGIDRIRNFEVLEFSDRSIIIDPVLAANNTPAQGTLLLEIANGTGVAGTFDAGDTLTVSLGSVTDGDNVPPFSQFEIVWQVEGTPGLGDFIDLEDPVTEAVLTGSVLVINDGLALELAEGLAVRAVGRFRDGDGILETVVSNPTPPFGSTAGVAPVVDGVLQLLPIPQNFGTITLDINLLLSNVTDADTPAGFLDILNLVVLDDGGAVGGVLSNEVRDPITNRLLQVDFTPAANFVGNITFSFDVTDGFSVVPAQASLEILVGNTAPVAGGPVDLGTVDEGGTRLITTAELLAGATDLETDPAFLQVVDVTLAPGSLGMLTDNFDGTWTFTGAVNDDTGVTLSYRVSDGDLVSEVTSAFLDILPDSTIILPPTGGTFNGTAAGETIIGSNVADVVNAAGGADHIFGNGGVDTLNGDGGDDIINDGAGNDTANGGEGNDMFVADFGNDTLDGGNGFDIYNASMVDGVTVNANLATGAVRIAAGPRAGNDTLISVEGIVTGTGADIVTGSAAANTIRTGDGIDRITAAAGDDYIDAGAGADRADGGAGNDFFLASAGNDRFNGGADIDTYSAAGATTAVVADLAARTATIAGGAFAGNDRIDNFENVTTGSGNDTVTGDGENNTIRTNAGVDIIDGAEGNDYIDGGAGNDTMTGGSGSDTFAFQAGFGNDVITDFDADPLAGQDRINIVDLGISSANFAARVDIAAAGADVLVTVDGTDTIRLNNLTTAEITFSDFVLFTT